MAGLGAAAHLGLVDALDDDTVLGGAVGVVELAKVSPEARSLT